MYRATTLIVVLTGALLCLSGGAEAFGQDDSEPLHAVGMLNVTETSPGVLQAARSDVTGPEGAKKDGLLSSVGMELAVLHHQNRMVGTKGVRALRDASEPRSKATDDDRRRGAGRIPSPISTDGQFVTVDAIASNGASGLLADLRQLGLQGGATAGRVVSGRLPISSIEEAASLSSLRGMVPSYARTRVGSVDSEADSAHRASQARRTSGANGSGQKVCALSDSYNQNGTAETTAEGDVQSGDLPGGGNPEGNTARVDVLDDSFDGSEASDEGRAMLQLIHDIAPGAELGFHTAFGGIGVFASGIRELADAGCTVIVDDVIILAEPFYQDGPIANAVTDVVNDGIPYFSSAGNNGQNSYEAPFRDSGESGVLSDTSEAHDFSESELSTETRQEITISEGGSFQVFSLQWTDPSALIDGSRGPDTDINVALVDKNDNVVAESSNDNINNFPTPFESFEFENNGSIDADNDGAADSTFALVIEKAGGPDPEEVKYIYTGSDFEVEGTPNRPTVYGHAMAEEAEAIAAASFFNTVPFNENVESAVLASYSSRGGIEVLFDENGNELSTPQSRQKPEIVGTDGVDNTFFGQNLPPRLDSDSDPNFFGTSAAAPNVAAIAGLMLQADPSFSPSDVYDRLESTAVDVTRRFNRGGDVIFTNSSDGQGTDDWSGHGFVRADRAVPEPSGVQITNESAEISSGTNRSLEVAWQKVGTEGVDEFLLERQFFNGAFVEQARIDAGGGTEFARTVEDLPVGEHTFRISALRNDSTRAVATTNAVVREDEVNVSVFPNPFSGSANLSVTLPEDRNSEGQVEVRIFDILGRQVARTIETEMRELERAGSQSISLNTRQIRSLGSGAYFFQVQGEEFTATTRAVRVR